MAKTKPQIVGNAHRSTTNTPRRSPITKAPRSSPRLQRTHHLPATQQPEPSNVFRFLDLPGELRNMIYSMVLPAPETTLAPIQRSSRNTSKNENKKRQYPFSLAHVNKQIRVEFFPLYCNNDLVIQGKSFARFVEDFVPCALPGITPVVFFPGKCGSNSITLELPTSKKDGVTDILPCLRRYLAVVYMCDKPDDDSYEQEVAGDKLIMSTSRLHWCWIKPSAQMVWYNFLERALLAVQISWDDGHWRTRVVVKHKYVEWWMFADQDHWRIIDLKKLWFEKHGLRDFHMGSFVEVVGPWGRA